MKKISVIIPMYNSEAFIRQCIQSLIDQTCQDWEALVIDDGSADRSLEVCEELGRADGRIKVYHQENKGVSAARNYGLDIAAGEYIYFLDSDDAIHPLLFEEMLRQVEEHHVEMAFCNLAKLDSQQLNKALARASAQDQRPQWQIADGEVSERWFHIDYWQELCGVSGLMARELIGPLRFDETLSYGEDTMFKYAMFSRQVRTAYSPQQWYYCRFNPDSLSHSTGLFAEDVYYRNRIQIRDSEHEKGHVRYAVIWETNLTALLRQRYVVCKRVGDSKRCEQVKEVAARECRHPFFRSVDLMHRSLFHLCFKCYPLYRPVGKVASLVWELMERRKK